PSSPAVELGPTLGLKKSSSLESLQTAMSEVNRKNELLPFHRPRPNMVRGRGCNESFRAAIDKSYDGPPEEEDDDGSELSSGRDTPASNSSRQGAGDQIEEKDKKDKKKKAKTKKKDKNKGKGKEKEKDKKKTEEPEETEKKSKKKGFALLRFGKRKEEKKEAKAAQQKHKTEILSDMELERLKDERERIEAKHPELREQRGGGSSYPDVQDDDADPNYAQINNFRERDMGSVPQPLSQSPPYSTFHHNHARTPSPQRPAAFPGHGNDSGGMPDGDPLDGLYAKVNKPRGAGAISPPAPAAANDGSMERIQQLRREYQQARREGMVPPYEELDHRRRGHDNDTHRMPSRGTDHRMAPRYEEVECHYASLPRQGPLDPSDYTMLPPWSGHYPGPPQPSQAYPQSPSYPNPNAQSGPSYPGYPSSQQYGRAGDHRGVEPGYYPHPSPHHQQPQPQQRGPLRQDVPPSPTPPLRGLRYDTMTRVAGGGGGYRHLGDPGLDHFGYTGEGGRRQQQQQQQHQTNTRQKNPMTAAV
ncbi:partitioning defective 3 homolog B-like, partial [Genypterus blacodes]|uniref:partitioning defective 3 homolog B-like n=1 Tax=Genypterus blacodes TaxID=154954 RepID=UPI003F757A8D